LPGQSGKLLKERSLFKCQQETAKKKKMCWRGGTPLCFLDLLILRELQTANVDLHILKGLRAQLLDSGTGTGSKCAGKSGREDIQVGTYTKS
jgi:hypothetical protein